MDIRTAYKVMYVFMDRYYWKRGPEKEFNMLGNLLGNMSFLCDGSTADSAVWNDWIDAAKKVKEDHSDGIDDFTGYKMMIQFIKDYNDIGSFPDTEAFYDMIKLLNGNVNNAVWQDWLAAVESVKKDPSDDRFLLKLTKP